MKPCSLIVARERARLAFDALWKGSDPIMTRAAAYAWLGVVLGIKDPKLGKLDFGQCSRVLHAAKDRVRERRELAKMVDSALAQNGLSADVPVV